MLFSQPSRGDIFALLRQGYQVFDYLRTMKRIYPLLVSKTAEQWVLTEFPPGSSIHDGKVVGPDGSELADAEPLIMQWRYMISAVTAWRLVAAVLENEAEFRDQGDQRLLRQNHRSFIDPFLPWDRAGSL